MIMDRDDSSPKRKKKDKRKAPSSREKQRNPTPTRRTSATFTRRCQFRLYSAFRRCAILVLIILSFFVGLKIPLWSLNHLHNRFQNTDTWSKPLTDTHDIRTMSNLILGKKTSPLLPDQLVVVTGLESSGTTFMSTVLAKAVGINNPTVFSNRGSESIDAYNQNRKYSIQHVSLPHGGGVGNDGGNSLPVIPFLVPKDCRWAGRAVEASQSCNKLGLQQMQTLPSRFFVNITSHIRWYRNRGVQATAVIMVRDKMMRLQSSISSHVADVYAAVTQNDDGLALIRHALKHLSHVPRMDGSPPEMILVSYETLMLLGDDFLFHLYDTLKISSNYTPAFVDGNSKYTQPSDELKDQLNWVAKEKSGASQANTIAEQP